MRVLACGGRDLQDDRLVALGLSFLTQEDVLIEGGARGADRLAADFARSRGVKVETFPANWNLYGKSAGYRRNAQMLSEGKPDLVVAFPGGRGTENMVSLATAAGVKVRRIMP